MSTKIPKKVPPMPLEIKSDTTGRIAKPVLSNLPQEKPILSFKKRVPREEPFEPNGNIKAQKDGNYSRSNYAKIMIDG